MRNMSFALTTEQFVNRRKTVTRRVGWEHLKPGDLLCGVVKGMGLRPGEQVERMAVIVVTDVRREHLYLMDKDDLAREGFPEMKICEFIKMFIESHGGCKTTSLVTRIEFKFIPGGRFNQERK